MFAPRNSSGNETGNLMEESVHVYEVRPRKDRRGVDLMSDVLPFGRPATSFQCGPASQDRAPIRSVRRPNSKHAWSEIGLPAGLLQVSGLGVRRFFSSKFLPEPAAAGLSGCD